jgi:hypothetical protein
MLAGNPDRVSSAVLILNLVQHHFKALVVQLRLVFARVEA